MQRKDSIVRTKFIRLNQIVRDPRCQIRDSTDTEYVEELADVLRSGGAFDGRKPVVFFDKKAKLYYLADGFHRCDAYVKADCKEMECEVHSGTLEDAEIFAHREANATHGCRLGKSEVRKKIEWHLQHERYGAFTDAQIARWCRCSQPSVTRARASSLNTHVLRADPPGWLDPTTKAAWLAVVEKGHTPRLSENKGKLVVVDSTEVGQKLKASREASKEQKAGEKPGPRPTPVATSQPDRGDEEDPVAVDEEEFEREMGGEENVPEPAAKPDEPSNRNSQPPKRGTNKGESFLGEEQLKNWADRLKHFPNAFKSWLIWNPWLELRLSSEFSDTFADSETLLRLVERLRHLIEICNPDAVCPACEGERGCMACHGCGFMPDAEAGAYEATHRN